MQLQAHFRDIQGAVGVSPLSSNGADLAGIAEQ